MEVCANNYRFRFLRMIKLFVRSNGRVIASRQLRDPFYIRAKGNVGVVHAGTHDKHGHIYKEVIIDDCYGIFEYAKRNTPKIFVDIGGHIGYVSKLASLMFPKAKIYCYEPNRDVHSLLRENVANTNVEIISAAVGDISKTVYLRNDEYSSGQTEVSGIGSRKIEQIASSAIADGESIDFMKMDCEGAEWSILKDEKLLKRTKVARFEYHLRNHETLENIVTMLKAGNHCVVYSKGGIKSPNFDEVGIVWSKMKQ